MITISNPVLHTIILWILLFLLCIISSRKIPEKRSFLDWSSVLEIRWLATLWVVFAHIGYALTSGGEFLFPLSVYAWVAVDIFLFLSWYGATIDCLKNSFSPWTFFKKRVFRLLPYLWVALIIILLCDYFLLGRSYSFQEILFSFIGFFPEANLWNNINSPYWYLTLTFFYYLIFPFLFIKRFPIISAGVMYLLSWFLIYGFWGIQFDLELSSQIINLYKLHIWAFPLWMIVARIVSYKENIQKYFNEYVWNHTKSLLYRKIISPSLNAIILIFLAYFIYHTGIYSGVWKGNFMEQSYTLITAGLIFLFFWQKKFEIKFLSFIGLYSYEIYLLHWPILSRYFDFYNQVPASVATLGYFCIILALSFAMQKLVRKLL